MKSSISALCIAAGVLVSSLSFAATPAAPAAPAAPMAAAAATDAAAPVTTPAKKVVKKHAVKKHAKAAKKAPVAM